jgi:uncharacterized protein YfaT (DUF1175 family)
MVDAARRRLLLAAVLGCLAPSLALGRERRLERAQSRLFRLWLLSIVEAQLSQGPTPRWQHRDCAGLVRFAVAEALRAHDDRWKRSMGLAATPLPPEIDLDAELRDALRHHWRLADGSTSAYVGALELVQENTRFVAREWQQALPGDLLFFDQGDDQHLMFWMGRRIAYHTGSARPGDNGLRAVELKELLEWKDTRWQPDQFNPNFAGIYRFSFLSDS